jgi:hypothetical protein
MNQGRAIPIEGRRAEKRKEWEISVGMAQITVGGITTIDYSGFAATGGVNMSLLAKEPRNRLQASTV